MKKVKFIETVSTIGANFLAGQWYALPDDLAKSLADAKHCVIVEPTPEKIITKTVPIMVEVK
jgi:hypothetical protein